MPQYTVRGQNLDCLDVKGRIFNALMYKRPDFQVLDVRSQSFIALGRIFIACRAESFITRNVLALKIRPQLWG
jgi:hypothetical protein